MQRSSETIGAIAAALAKAQAEAHNPEEERCTATIRASNPREQDQTFRYAGAVRAAWTSCARRWAGMRIATSPDDGDRRRGGARPPHHDARSLFRRMAFIRVAGLRD